MKKKLSVAFVLTLTVTLVAMVAMAAVLLSGYFDEYAKLEGTYGSYTEWPTEAKMKLVSIMLDHDLEIDVIKANELLKEDLTEEQQDKIATEIIVSYFGSTDYMTIYNIMEHELGSFGKDDWTPQDMAQYSKLMQENEIGPKDQTQYFVPQTGDITKEQAIDIAKNTLMHKYSITAEQLNTYEMEECSFVMLEGNEPEWFIWFVGDRSPVYDNNSFSIRISKEGDIKDTSAPTMLNSLNEEFDKLLQDRGMFVTWSLEEKYEFCKIWPIMIDQWMEKVQKDQAPIRQYIHYLASKTYLLPGTDDIAEELSLQTAKDALVKEIESDDLSQFVVYKSFMLNEHATRVWRWFFIPNPAVDSDCGYRIDINAKTGDLVEVLHQFASKPLWGTFYE